MTENETPTPKEESPEAKPPPEKAPVEKKKVSATEGKIFRRIESNKPQTRKYLSNQISSGKYTVFTFLPKFLYEQFRRYSNVFFLSISMLQQIPGVSPTGQWTTLGPFVFILTVSAVKEIIEDFKRHRADRSTNTRKVAVFKGGTTTDVIWSEVQVGDFVKIFNEQGFPADLVLYSSSEETGICYIETSNLDGETNLKIRQAIPATAKVKDGDIPSITGHIECEEPNRFLYEFLGKVSLDGQHEEALGPDQILLRGSKLQNTQWIIGQVIYTGHESKLMKNSSKAPLKQSTVDKMTNRQIFLLFLLLMAIGVTGATLSLWWDAIVASKMWYFPEDKSDVSYGFPLTMATYVILFNNLIPISLTVTLEIVRFIQAKFIDKDLEMYYEVSDIPAVAKTSNLNEELGIIRYIFSDKTGTLTQNVMEFKGASIGGTFYDPDSIGDGDSSPLMKKMRKNSKGSEDIMDFLIILAVCHTVIPDRSTGELVYHASSPDERALVMGAEKYGFAFQSRTPNTVTIIVTVGGKPRTEVYELLNVLDFTSDRKRMSIVVRRPNGSLALFCKGADMMVYDRLSKDHKINDEKMVTETQSHLDAFSRLGLRTLCLAIKPLQESEYKAWSQEYHAASVNTANHDKAVAAAEEKIEQGLRLIGATAIEDKLQDEVPETIATLLRAGISIWVLTGDKQETAINIGRSCNLIKPDMELFIINQSSVSGTYALVNSYLDRLHSQFGEQIPEDIDAAVVIDGKTLRFATNKEVKADFVLLCTSCRVVICCRASPFQKAEIVAEVTKKTGKITLAIGDGANDVAMIQKAHVGVGIAGVEGLQAASSSDYSIGQFKFLQKLLLVHGAWNYNRIGKVILYCFYKNIFFYTIELWFAVDSGFSASILFEQWSIAFYNMAFTATQPLAIGLFEKNVRAEMRMKFPGLYVENQASFSMTIFMMWVGVGLVQSVVLYVMCSAIVSHGVIWSNGHDGGLTVLGTCVYTYVIVIASLKAGIEIKAWTWPSHLAIWGSISVWFIFVPLYGAICASIRGLPTDMIGIAGMLYRSYVFWLGLPIVVLVCFIPELTFAVLKNHFASASEEEQRRLEDVLEEDQDSREKLISEGESTLLVSLDGYNRDETRSNLTMSEVEAQQH